MDYMTAKKQYIKNYYSGRNLGKVPKDKFCYGVRYLGERFVQFDIPLRHLNPKPSQPEIVTKYMNTLATTLDVEFPPIWVSLGRKMKDGLVIRYGNIRILDGNHRCEAFKQSKKQTILVISPESHYRLYEELYNV